MSILFLPVVLCVDAALAKGGARLFRRTLISWPLCFLFAGVLSLLGTLVPVVVVASGGQVHFAVLLAAGALVEIAIGAVFFSKFARTAAGGRLDRVAAAQLAAIVVGLSCAVGTGFPLLVALTLRMLMGHGP